jgi:hypothetical protein
MESLASALVTAGVAVVITVVVLVVVRRLVPLEILADDIGVGGLLMTIAGTLYAVLVAFAVVIVWNAYDSTSDVVDREASALNDVVRLSKALPAATSLRIGDLAERYTADVVQHEWPAMALGKSSPTARDLNDEIWSVVTSIKPTDAGEQATYGMLISRVVDFTDARRKRLFDSTSSLPGLIWLILIAGGVLTLAFTFFFGIKNLLAQIIMTAMCVVTVVLILWLINDMDGPFTGDIRITSGSFQALDESLQKLRVR